MKKTNIILSVLIITIIALYVANPAQGISASLYGVTVWATILLPALFPFFFFTRILSELGFIEKIAKLFSPITKKLYNAPGVSGYVYVMSILSGYPVGAKITADLYTDNKITYGQACRITSFTSTSGPLFIIGTVGIGMFSDFRIGLIIAFSHLVGAILNGLIYRKYEYSNNEFNVKTFNVLKQKNILEDAMLSSIKSIMIVGGYVTLFFLIISMLNNNSVLTPVNYVLEKILAAFKLPANTAGSITNGIIEITRGCIDLSKLGLNPKISVPILTGIITFGGFSIHMQALTFLNKFNIKLSYYFTQKLTHTLISVILSIIFVQLF